MSRISLGGKHVGETRSEVFDFTSRLGLAETISSAVTTATVYSGTDAAPETVINGAASISGAQVTQSLKAGVVGVTYLVRCVATTSLGQVLALGALLVIVPDSL